MVMRQAQRRKLAHCKDNPRSGGQVRKEPDCFLKIKILVMKNTLAGIRKNISIFVKGFNPKF
jgi:hypothetical protein